MGALFGKKKPPSSVTEQDHAVLQMKMMRDKLKQHVKRLEVAGDNDRVLAKQLLASGRKDRALVLLRKKKWREQLHTKVDGQLEQIERLIGDVEFASVQHEVLASLAVGNESLKRMHQLLSLEDAERIMDESQRGIEYQREIDDLLVANGVAMADVDESELERELAELTEGEEVQLPEVPAGELPAAAEPERQKREKARVAVEAS